MANVGTVPSCFSPILPPEGGAVGVCHDRLKRFTMPATRTIAALSKTGNSPAYMYFQFAKNAIAKAILQDAMESQIGLLIKAIGIAIQMTLKLD
jgi:hypothetical protein